MTEPRALRRRIRHGRGIRGALVASVLAVAGLTLLAVACTGDTEPSAPSTTAAPTTSAPPPPTGAEESEPEEPPEPAWVVQVGGPAADSLLGVAARDDEVVATGYTEGALSGQNAGGRDVLVAAVGTDGAVRSLQQAGEDRDDSALGVGAGEGATVACGYTQSAFGAPNAGSADAWCAPVDADGALGTPYQQGGSDWDRLYGAAMVPDGSLGYTGGYTLGLFPGASDSSAGLLGEGDALLWQIRPDGTPSWIRQFGSEATDWGQGVAATSDGDALIVGYTQGAMGGPSNGGTDGFIARFDPSGLPRWIGQFGTEGADWPKGVAVGGSPTAGTESFVTVGSTDGALAPALGGERNSLRDAPRADGAEPAPINAGGTDAMVLAFDTGGDQVWAAQLGSEGAEDAIGVGVDGSTVLVAGTTSGALATNGDPAAGGKDGFLAALDLADGRLRWITQFGSPGDEDVGGLAITEDGLVVVSGQTTGQLGDAPNAGAADGFLVAFPLPGAGGSAASAL